MVTCQSSELGWEVIVELPADFLSLGRGSYHPKLAKGGRKLKKEKQRTIPNTLNKMKRN